MDGCSLKKICFIYKYYHTYLHKCKIYRLLFPLLSVFIFKHFVQCRFSRQVFDMIFVIHRFIVPANTIQYSKVLHIAGNGNNISVFYTDFNTVDPTARGCDPSDIIPGIDIRLTNEIRVCDSLPGDCKRTVFIV